MTQFSHGAGIKNKNVLDAAVKAVVVECLEQRQYMSAALDNQPALLSATSVDAVNAEHKDTLTDKREAQIQKQITNFQKTLRSEIHQNLHKLTNAKFEAHVMAQQTTFANHIAKEGGSYTPIPYADLTVGTAPLTPPTLTATSTNTNQINLNWSVVSGATKYTLQSSINGANWSTLATQTTTTYSHLNLAAGSTHKYRVNATVGTKATPYSTVVTSTSLLAAPIGFTAITYSATRVDLSWVAYAHATGYKVERSTNGTVWSTLLPNPVTPGSTHAYTDTVTAGGTYLYRLSAISTTGTSATTAVVTATTPPAAPVLTSTATNATTGSLAWAAVTGATSYEIDLSTDGGNTWNAIANQTTLTFPLTNLTPDTATKYHVIASNAAGKSAASNVGTVTTLLAAPSGLTAQPLTPTTISISWNPSPDVTTYKVERSTNQTTWTAITPAPTGTAVTVVDTVSAGTLYYYRISSIGSAGTSAISSSVTALTLPIAPTLTATANSAAQVTLNWTAVTGATGYLILHSADGGVTWTTLASPTGLTYANTGLSADTAYQYIIYSLNASGVSAGSNALTASTLLAPPTGLTATTASATSVSLAWNPVPDATNYKIERSPDQKTWTALTPNPALNGASFAYTDSQAVAGTNYFYRVSSMEGSNPTSVPSAVVHALTLPATPTTLTASVTSASNINLTWTTVTFATSYLLEVSTDGGTTWSTVVTQSGTSYAASGLTANTSYDFRVSAINATGGGSPTTGTTATTLPVAPVGVSATANSASQATISWTTVIGATNYKIERSTDQLTWTALSPNPALTGGSSSYADTTASAGTTYYYRVSNITNAATSTPSVVVHALTNPGQPVVTATAYSNTQINLTWPAVSSATSYLVETSLDGGVTWSTLGTPVAANYSATALTTDTSYSYRVTANNATGTGATSSVHTVVTLLAAPTGFTATGTSATSIVLNWPQIPDATGYKLERSTNQTTWTPTTIGSGSTITSTDSSVTGGVTYYYRLSAVDAAGTSAPSTVVHVLTVPTVPTLAVTAVSATQINASWNTIAGANSYTLESSTDGGITWATVASPVTTSYSNTGLTTGLTYTYRVSANDASGSSGPSSTQSTATLLTAPTGFAASSTAATSMTLSWNAPSTATNYTIQRSTDQTTWTTLSPNPALTGTSSSYADSQVVAGTTYYYRIASVNSAGTSTNSAVIHAITIPAAPVLTASVVSATQVNLTWPAITSATSYKVEVSPDSGTTWIFLASVTTLSYSDTGEAAGTVYTYRVSAFNAAGQSAFSNEPAPTTLLAAPAGFTSTAQSGGAVNLAWTAVTGATNYIIDRSTDGVTFSALAPNPALSGASTTYADTLAAAGTTYFYKIAAVESAGNSAFSPVAQSLTYPATPTTLTGTSTSATTVTLTWTSMKSATSYLLESSPDGSTWSTLATQAATTYVNTALTTDTLYYYRVSATNATGTSTPTSQVTTTTLLTAPASPAAVVATATEIDLTWTDVTGATSYKIERSLDQNTWTTLAPNPALGQSDAAYADTTAASGYTYYYRISATGPSITSVPGTIVHAATYPVTPTLTATPANSTTINLSWTASARATGYYLETSTDGGNTWAQLTTSGTATTFSNTGLTADSSYEYRVSPIGVGGTGATSSVQTVSTMVAVPTGFSDTAISAGEIDLAWTAVTDATNYKIERSTNQTVWTTIVPNPALNGSSAAYDDLSVNPGVTYYYRISAIGANGTSQPAASVNAQTYPGTPSLSATAASATTINVSWTAVVGGTSYLLEHSTDGGTTWSTLATQAGTTYANTALTADTSYEYRVSAIDTSGTGVVSSVLTIKTLLAPPTVTPAAVSSSEIDLTWPSVTDATGFKVERSLDQTVWSTLTPNPALTGSATGYNDTSVAAGTTYYYRVSAINALGTSNPSTVTSALSYSASPNLTATSTAATTVSLTWAATKGATSYIVEKSTDGGNTWSAVVTQAGTTYANTALAADTTYQYQIAAINATGTGAYGNPVTVTTLLTAPAAFTVTGVSAHEIDLAWTAESDATNYKIERSPNGTTLWTTITPAVPLTGTSAAYADTTVSAGTTYYYRVSAIDGAGTSAPATVTSGLSLPAAPTLTATAASATSVTLTWTAAIGATSYLVESSADGGVTWGSVTTVTTTTYTNTALTSDTPYEYRVSGINASGTGLPSTVVNVTTLLAAPAGFTATAASGTEIDLAWTAVTDATTYKIQRSLTGTSGWTTITPAVPLNGTSSAYADTSVLSGTTYYYQVSAIDAAGTSAPATGHALTYSAAPTLTGAAFSSTVVNLNWTTSFGATNYLLERSADGGNTWSTVVTQTGTSYSNVSLTPDTTYEYRVSAINATGTGTASNVLLVATLLPAPSGTPVATPVSSTEIDIAWNPVTDATGYLIERSLNNAVWTALTPTPALTGASTSYADTTVVAGTSYFYRVSAINAAGTSAPSTVVSTIAIPDVTTVTAVAASDTEIDITWTPMLGAASYVVQASADGGNTWTVIATPTAPEYANTTLTGDTNYEYEVASVDSIGGTSIESPIVTVTTLLSPVTNFAGTATSPTNVNLTWTPVADATNYLIESSPDQQSWIALNTSLTGLSGSFSDTTVTAGQTVYYRITAINANGSSAASSVITVITPLAAPVGLAATAVSSSQINLTWTADIDTGLTNLRLESSADGSTNWTAVAIISPTATSVSDIRLTTGTTYYYRLIAMSAGGDSAPSTVVHATTM